MKSSKQPLFFQIENFKKLRAKSLETSSFFEKVGYSNFFLPHDANLNAKTTIQAEEEANDDFSTNAPESRAYSLKYQCDISNNQITLSNNPTENLEAKSPKKNVILKLKPLINKMLKNSIDICFSDRFAHIEQLDEDSIEVWEF